MENAILKTLIYADIFDYPLKAWEVHKWLIEKKGNLRQVEKALKKLNQESKIENLGSYYYLPRRKILVGKRIRRYNQSKKYIFQAKLNAQLFRVIPWVKLVGISGSLAMENSSKKDDVDFFIITSQKRLWLSRLFLTIITGFLGKRRKRGESLKKVAGKFCINILLEEDSLGKHDKNIFLAHEILQMKVLYDKDNIYQKFLEDNKWVFKYLPNWKVGNVYHVSSSKYYGNKTKKHNTKYIIPNTIKLGLEKLARDFQLKYMGKPQGMEKITENALYFHPKDKGPKVLKDYYKKIKKMKLITQPNGFDHSM